MRALPLLLLALVGCSYSPNFASGTLQCSKQGTCPQGYECVTSQNTCWKKGTAPDQLVGRWVFDSTGKLEETCTAMPTMTSSLAGDFVDVTAGTTSDLIGTYYCAWNLDLAAGDPTKASIVAGQSCQTTSGNMNITMHGDSFDFASADGANATMAAQFTATYVTGPALTCVFKISGKLALTP